MYSFFHDLRPSSFTCRKPWTSGQLLVFRKVCGGEAGSQAACGTRKHCRHRRFSELLKCSSLGQAESFQTTSFLSKALKIPSTLVLRRT